MRLPRNIFGKAWMLLFLLPIGLLFIYLNQFIFSSGAPFSDLVISHLPNAIFLKSTLLAGQGIPFWSPTILSGYPFIADPLSGLFYPLGWLVMLFPWAVGFNLLIALHMLWGGIGLFFYLRAVGLKLPGALAGGLMFEALPKLFAHFEAGHISLVYAVCWTPWLLLAETKWGNLVPWSADGVKRLWRAPGVVLGLIFLIDSRWAAFAGLIWLFYALSSIRREPVGAGLHIEPNPGFLAGKPRWLRGSISIGLQIALAACIAAPLAIPLLQYTHLSSRASMAPDEAFTYSLPPARLLGIIFPDMQGGTHEWTFYPGCFGLIFAIICLFSKSLRVRTGFWLWVLLISLIYSLGSNIPGLKLITYLPGFDLLRVPPRILFAAGLAFAILSAYAVDRLHAPEPEKLFGRPATPKLILAGIAFFSLLMAAAFAVFGSSLSFDFAWGAGCCVLAVIWIFLRLSEKVKPDTWLVGVIALALVSTCVIEFRSLSPHSPDHEMAQNNLVAAYIQSQSGQPFRVYSPSYSLPQQTAVLAGLQMADGIDPLQLVAYDRFMAVATGIPLNGYSVVVPPAGSGDIAKSNQTYVPDPIYLGLLNIRYVVSDFDFKPVNGLVLEKQIESTRIYVNNDVMPRAWVQPDSAVDIDQNLHRSVSKVDLTQPGPNEMDVTASGPGLLVLSEINYPGWFAWVDGKPETVQTAFTLLRSVTLPSGTHKVVFKFVPVSFYLGIGLFALPWLSALLLAIWNLGRGKPQD